MLEIMESRASEKSMPVQAMSYPILFEVEVVLLCVDDPGRLQANEA